MHESEPSWYISENVPEEVQEYLENAVTAYQEGNWTSAAYNALHAVDRMLKPEPDDKESARTALTQAFDMVNKFAENDLSVNDVKVYVANLEVR